MKWTNTYRSNFQVNDRGVKEDTTENQVQYGSKGTQGESDTSGSWQHGVDHKDHVKCHRNIIHRSYLKQTNKDMVISINFFWYYLPS